MKKELEASSVMFTECILFNPKFKGDGAEETRQYNVSLFILMS